MTKKKIDMTPKEKAEELFAKYLDSTSITLMSEEANKLRKQGIQVPPKYEKVTEVFYRKKI